MSTPPPAAPPPSAAAAAAAAPSAAPAPAAAPPAAMNGVNAVAAGAPAIAAAPPRGHSHHESHASLTEALQGLSYRADTPELQPLPLPLPALAEEVMEVDVPAAATAAPPHVVAVAPAPAAVAAVAAAPSAEQPVSVVTESGEVLFEAERIVAKRKNTGAAASGASTSSARGGASDPRLDPESFLFKVKWRGFAEKDSTWEPYANISNCTDLLEAFFQEDAANTLAKKQQRKEKKEAAAAAAAFSSEAFAAPPAAAHAAAPAPSRTSSTGRTSLGSKLSSFPAGALECGVCGQTAAASGVGPDAFVFCKTCFAPAHRTHCSEGNGTTHAGVWSCSACAMANSMAPEQQVDAGESKSADDVAMASEPVTRTEQLRSLLLAIQNQVTRDDWQSVPLAAHGNAAVDWQSLATIFQSCCTHTAAAAALSELVDVGTYEHLLAHLLVPALEYGASLRLVTGDGSHPTLSQRESMLKAVSACSLTLQLLSIPNVPRRLIQEEHVRSVTLFLLHAMREVIMPLYDSNAREKVLAQVTGGVAPTPAAAKKKGSKSKNVKDEDSAAAAAKHEEDSDDDVVVVEDGPSSGGPDPSYWLTLQGHLRYLVHKSASLLQLLTRFQSLEKYPEMLANKVQDICFVVLALTPVSASSDVSIVHSLQNSCAHWLQKHFLRGDSATRHSIFDSVAQTYRALNPMRRNLRTYVVHSGTQRAGVKKEESKGGAASADTLSAAIGSAVPLPSASLHPRDQPQVSVQLLTALVCELLQSLSTQPLIAESSSSSNSLLERIQREVRAKEMVHAAQAAAEADAASAAAAAASSKKGAKAKGKRRNSKDDTAVDVEMKNAEASDAAALSSSSLDTPFSALQSALDTPAVREEFVSTLTAPVQTEKKYARFFLMKLLEYVQPPPKEAASTNALSRKSSKLILRNFMEDLLQLLFAPEFPVAEVLLPRFVQLLLMAVDGKDGGNFSEGLRLIAMPLLGLFTIHVKLHSSISSSHPILFRPQRQLDDSDGGVQGGEELDCICGVRKTAATQQELEAGAENAADSFLLDCDSCHAWFHGECVGFRADSCPANWHCQRCVIRMECDRQTEELHRKREKLVALRQSLTGGSDSGSKKSKKAAGVSEHESAAAAAATASLEDVSQQLDVAATARVSASVLRQLLINYLNVQVAHGEDEAALYARQYDLTSWLQQAVELEQAAAKKREAEQKGAAAHTAASVSPAFQRDLEACQLNWDPPGKSSVSGASAAAASASSSGADSKNLLIPREVAVNMSRQLASDRPSSVLKWAPRVLESLCARCNDPAPTCRAAAVAAIADLVRVDSQVLKNWRVKEALQKRVCDSSITTREAVVDLIGTFILQAQQDKPAGDGNAAVDADYFNFVVGRLNDSGISVRKKVVRILRDLCLQPQPHPRYTELAERLILCVRDSEESMQSLSVTIVYEMWFDRQQPHVRDRIAKAKLEPIVKIEGQQQQQQPSAQHSSSPFTQQFQQLVHHIVGVISRLSAVPGGEGAECLSDILLLLLEQDAALSKSGSSASGEMTSLTGLRMTLLKVKKAQRAKSKAGGAHGRRPSAAASSLSAAFEKEGSAKAGRGKGKAAAAAADNSADPNSIRRICEDMVTVVVSMLVKHSAEEGAGSAVAAGSSQAANLPSMLQLIQTLHVFSQVFSPFLIPHVQTLQPYLKLALPASVDLKSLSPAALATFKEQTARDTTAVGLLLGIFHEVLPILAAPNSGIGGSALMSKAAALTATSLSTNRDFVARLQVDLSQILVKSVQPNLIKGAVSTWVLVCEQLLQQPELIVQMCRVAIYTLWASQLAPLTTNGVRCAIMLGLILRHFDMEGHINKLNAALPLGAPRTAFWQLIHEQVRQRSKELWPRLASNCAFMLKADQLENALVVEPVFKLFQICLNVMLPTAAQLAASPQEQRTGAKTSALSAFSVLEGIIALFSRMPQLIGKASDAIQRCLASPQSSAELQRHSLRAIREFLQSEDRRLQKSQRAERAEKKKSTPSKKGKKNEQEDDDAQEEEEEEEEDDGADDEEITLDDVAAAGAGGQSAAAGTNASSWTKYQEDTADFLPSLVSACENQVYQLALASSPLVRREALQLMGVILHQAVTNPIDAMPTLVAALTDREPLPSREAINIVTQTIARKKEWIRFMEQRFVDGIRLSFHMQSNLWPMFDPLHRRNIAPSAATPVFDRTPTDGLAHAYGLIRKLAASRKLFCSKLVNDLMSVAHIGIFAREQVQAELPQALQSFASPTKASPSKAAAALAPHPSLGGRSTSVGSGASQHGRESPRDGSQPTDEDFPAFEPPAFVRANTDPSFAASPASLSSMPSGQVDGMGGASDLPGPPAHPLAFLAYLAVACTSFPFEDDESMHLSVHLSKVINTRGADLQARMQRTIVQLKTLHAEHVSEEEIELSQTLQLAQSPDDAAAAAGANGAAAANGQGDEGSLLAELRLQGESAMAITILIRLRHWLQESYDLSGRFEEWNMNASGNASLAASSATGSSSRAGPLRLKKVADLPLLFNDLPLDDAQAEALVSSQQGHKQHGGAEQSPTKKVAGRSQKGAAAHARSASMPAVSLARSIVPALAQAQFATFHSAMERSAVFLSAKKRGHKRSATVGAHALTDEASDAADTPTAKKARTAGGSGSKGSRAGSKKKAAKRRRGHSDGSSEEEEEEEEWMDTDDAPPSRKAAKGAAGAKTRPSRAAASSKKRAAAVQRIQEEEEEEEPSSEEEAAEEDE